MTSISRIIFTVNFQTPGAPGDWTPKPPTFIWCSKPLGVCRSLQQLKNIAAAATKLQHQLPASKIRGPKLLGNVPFLPSSFYILPGHITPSGQEVKNPGIKNRRNPTKKLLHLPGTGGRPVPKLRVGVFTLSRFLAIYGSLGVCDMSARAAGPGNNLSTGYPQQRL